MQSVRPIMRVCPWKTITYNCPSYAHGIRHCHAQYQLEESHDVVDNEKRSSSHQTGKKIQAMCLNDKSYAKKVASVLLPHLAQGSTHECFPGSCFLSREIYQKNTPLTLWEPRLVHRSNCQELKKELAVSVKTKSLLNRKSFLPFVANLETEFLQNVIVPYSSQFHSFLYCILTNLNNLTGITAISLFLWMPQSDFKDFMGDPSQPVLEQKGASVLSLSLPLTFQSQCLLKVPLGAFSNMTLKKSHDDQLYLVKTKISSGISGQIQGKSFLDFLKLVHLHRAKRLIPELEQMCPGIGVDLIKLGYTTRSKLKCITPRDIFQIYEIIIAKRGTTGQDISSDDLASHRSESTDLSDTYDDH